MATDTSVPRIGGVLILIGLSLFVLGGWFVIDDYHRSMLWILPFWIPGWALFITGFRMVFGWPGEKE